MIRVIFEDNTSKKVFINKLKDLSKSFLDLTMQFDDGEVVSTHTIFINDEDVQLAEYSCLVYAWDKCIAVSDAICEKEGLYL